MGEVIVPNFGEVLAEYLSDVEADALPFLLAQLERTAAARYRQWADEVPEHREGLLACAVREDEIADRAEALFPPTDDHRAQVFGMIGPAKAAYYAVFDGYTPLEQMTIQASAERQGAGAWQSLKDVHPAEAEALDELSGIEAESADYLDNLLSSLA
jgi:hypothetical protein